LQDIAASAQTGEEKDADGKSPAGSAVPERGQTLWRKL
jgi:hypothetical protein